MHTRAGAGLESRPGAGEGWRGVAGAGPVEGVAGAGPGWKGGAGGRGRDGGARGRGRYQREWGGRGPHPNLPVDFASPATRQAGS